MFETKFFWVKQQPFTAPNLRGDTIRNRFPPSGNKGGWEN